MAEAEIILSQARTAINLLERLSADSQWAHRGSGYRGALLRLMDSVREFDLAGSDHQTDQVLLDRLQNLIDASFDLLEKAAMEIIA
jgi:hypothetical protein